MALSESCFSAEVGQNNSSHGPLISRTEAVAFYCEGSPAQMERLRSYAISHRRGFTIDVEIHPAAGPNRWMRLIAAPVCLGNQAARLQGPRLII